MGNLFDLSVRRAWWRPPSLSALVLIVAQCLAPVADAARGCLYPRHRFYDNAETPVAVTAMRNSPCRFSFAMRKSTVANKGIISVTPVVRPKHGKLQRASMNEYLYYPDRNYVGQDYYELIVKYDRSGTTYTTRVKATVTVQAPPGF